MRDKQADNSIAISINIEGNIYGKAYTFYVAPGKPADPKEMRKMCVAAVDECIKEMQNFINRGPK